MGTDQATIWMRCPYNADLCGADATLDHFTSEDYRYPEGGWSGVLLCLNGHEFQITQRGITTEDDE